MTERNEALNIEREAFRKNPSYNWADFQKAVRACGGDALNPSLPWNPRSPGDNMALYGFVPVDDLMVYSVLDDEFKLPSFSGVYAVTAVYHRAISRHETVTGYLHLLYIGSARDIEKRMKDKMHWYNRFKEREEKHTYIHLWVIPTPDYKRIERDLIRRMRPLLNIHHRNG